MSEATWPDLLAQLINREDLTAQQTSWAMDQVMSGDTSPVQLAGFLAALATKGETVAELRGLADSMISHATEITVPPAALDIVGTGGDRARTVNVSTMAALVLAGCGVPIVKHGNRASSSASGSADFLEALGIDLSMGVPEVTLALEEVGITFLFATVFHPSMRYAAPARKELGVGTAFNVLGPLTNPGRPGSNAIGVASARHAPIVAGVLAERGNSAVVFRGADNGLDELSTTTVNDIWLVKDGEVRFERLDATRLGLAPVTVADLRGGDAAVNARIGRRVFAGEAGPVTDTVLLNAAAGLIAFGYEGTGRGSLEDRFSAALGIARASLLAGKAQGVVERWVEFSHRVGSAGA